MKDTATDIVVLTTETLSSDSVEWIEQQSKGKQVEVLFSGSHRKKVELPKDWRLISAVDYFDTDEYRDELVSFLGRWPLQQVSKNKNYHDMFSYPGGYSAWWLIDDDARVTHREVSRTLKFMWQISRALKKLRPRKVFLLVSNSDLVGMVESLLKRLSIEYDFLPSSATPSKEIWNNSKSWHLKSLLRTFWVPIALLIRAIITTLIFFPFRKEKLRKGKPYLVITSAFPRHFQIKKGGIENWYFTDFFRTLSKVAPSLHKKFMIYTTRAPFGDSKLNHWFFHSGWRKLRTMTDMVPLEQTRAGLGSFLRHLPLQLRFFHCNYRLEQDTHYRASFVFADTDISALFVPMVRASVGRMAYWAASVDAICKCIESAGEACGMLVTEEMYKVGKRYIAAAKKLGIPSIGVQHGSIFPSHLVYILPPEQLEDAPICDYFAVYGEYAAHVLSDIGSYPKDRIWITGSPRFDQLATKKPNPEDARRRLGLNVESRIILVATQDYEWFPEAVIAICELCKDRSDMVVAVKMHPNDRSLSYCRQRCQVLKAENTLFFDDRFDDLLEACDVLISGTSTTILEATVMGRKTICVNFSGEQDPYPFAEEGPSIGARTYKELEEALSTVFDVPAEAFDERRRAFLERHLGPTMQGKSAVTLSKRIAEFCKEDSKSH